MTNQDEVAGGDVAVVPVDVERGLALVLGAEVTDATGWRMPRGLIADALNVGGVLGGAVAAKPFLDGSVVVLAPETVARLKDGASFVQDGQGFALGTLTETGKGFTDAARFFQPPKNPVRGCR